ncbi:MULTISPECIES: asparagine synthase-related protein [unclassified Butyrivibrio]|uniref:asparagine synthase-related protein n=1 Tax=unclassified Butyrivibrio TaxID=2639466 RepID=UPI0003B38C6B|nr:MULTISPECIES: asparagine synthetase B family protein [unclassified Butyrivibrio]MDC7294818.1 asparagine synthase-related protein [Butyrivibrio sp. DSM 10294]
MSAIWGMIDLNGSYEGEKENNEFATKMKSTYEKYAIDRYDECCFDRGFFACGLQYYGSRAEKEVLPIRDNDKGYIFTADIVLSGRKKLLKELSESGIASMEALEKEPDGNLAYLSWLIWNKEFVNHIIGAFAIAVFDVKKNEFFLFADHMGSRCINYFCCDGRIIFSTLTSPIVDVLSNQYREINDRWIVACEADDSPQLCYYPGETPYKNIQQVTQGSFVHIKHKESGELYSKEECYWYPEKLPKLKLKPDEYRKLFRDTFFECVRDAVDTDVPLAATISSGLDSTSVSGVAANILKEDGRKLYGFTSVPLSDFNSKYDWTVVTDETKGVKTFLEQYSNIQHEFDHYEGKSGLTELHRIVDFMEVPVKAMRNAVWIDDILEKAKGKGCKVLLLGQGGNTTISRGHVLSRVYYELRHLRFMEAKRQLAAFGFVHGISRKELFNVTLAELSGRLFQDIGIKKDYLDYMDSEYIKGEMLRKHGMNRLFKKHGKRFGYHFIVNDKEIKRSITDKGTTQNKSIFNTKIGLFHGIILKDPTIDKRLVELVMRMPESEFCDNGLDRRLVRGYLDDIIPDKVRLEFKKRGLQGADATYRINQFGKEYLNKELVDVLWKYLNKDKVLQLLSKKSFEEDDVDNLLRILTLNEFLTKEKSRM